MNGLLACIAGVLLDAVFGDPAWLYHPVRLIGKWIAVLDERLRRRAGENPRRLYAAGVLMWFLVVTASAGVPLLLLVLVGRAGTLPAFLLETFWCWQLLAAKSLKTESRKVYGKLKENDLEGARYAVSMIVGRDTAHLTEEGVIRAAVETVAENTSDGVIAPLFYLMLGGAPLGFAYKAVNTMDSMVGYKNETYLYFGRFAAKLDDLFNYIPARLSALLMIASAALCGLDWRGAWRIYMRDRRKHASPNAAQTESVCAGALGVQLAGDAYYFGKLHHKEKLGDELRPVCPEDILRAGRLMDGTELFAVLLFAGLKYIMIH